MTTFEDLGLSRATLTAIRNLGYEEPTPVQAKAIPLVLEGSDVIAAAKTGTGKTGAFALPSMDKLPHAKGGQGPLMLVVTPTRELAQQITEVCAKIAESTHHRIVCVVGGLSYKPQIEKLRHSTDVLIATPGRLIDLMNQHAVRLGDVQTLVLDEADRMLDMGFLPSVRKIVAATPKERQTLLFSATIDQSVTKNVGSLLTNPKTVEIAHKGEVADTIDQYLIRTPQAVKPALIKEVLAEKGAERVIVFARTRSRADSTCRRLRRAGYKVEAIHSDRTQNQRRRALDKFAAGEVNIICATDVLARGIDVDAVDYVINYDLPTQPEDYVHRIGRTGRAGERGFAISFVTPETEDALHDIEKLTKQKIPEMQLENFDFKAEAIAAANKQQAFRAKQDPEVAQAKREMQKRNKKKRAKGRANGNANEGAQHAKGAGEKGKKRGASAKRAANGAAGRKDTTQRKRQAPSKNGGKNKGNRAPQKPADRQAHGGRDVHPGRAHRDAVRRARTR